MRWLSSGTLVAWLVFALFLLAINPAWAAGPTVGDRTGITRHCSDLKSLRYLLHSAILPRDRKRYYQLVVGDKDFPCYDQHLYGSNVRIEVTLKELIEVHPWTDKLVIQVWRAEDEDGVVGYTWFKIRAYRVRT